MKHRLLLAFFLLLLQCSLVEFTARYVASVRPLPAARLVNSTAYCGAPYYNATFRRELDQVWGLWEDTGGLLIPRDYSGTYFAFSGGFRSTTGQPVHYLHTLWLVGNSMALDISVPNNLTVASQLQRLLSAYRIMNAGAIGAVATTATARLKTLPVQRGDLVIIYSGKTEVYSVFARLRDARRQEFACASLDFMALTDAYCRQPYDPGALAIEVKDMAAQYRRALDEARVWSAARGAKVINVLEPHFWSTEPGPGESDLIGPLTGANGTVALVAQKALLDTGSVDLDLTHSLDGLRAVQPVYADEAHVNGEADEIIARAIFDYLTIY